MVEMTYFRARVQIWINAEWGRQFYDIEELSCRSQKPECFVLSLRNLGDCMVIELSDVISVFW